MPSPTNAAVDDLLGTSSGRCQITRATTAAPFLLSVHIIRQTVWKSVVLKALCVCAFFVFIRYVL